MYFAHGEETPKAGPAGCADGQRVDKLQTSKVWSQTRQWGNLQMLVFLRLTAVLIWHGKADRNWQVKLDLQLLCIAKTGKTARTYQWIWPIDFSEVSLCNWGENTALQLEVGQPLSSCYARGNKISLLSVSFFFFLSFPTSNRNIVFLKNKTCFRWSGKPAFEILLGGNLSLFRRLVQHG